MREQLKGKVVEVLFELNELNVKEFLIDELIYLDLCMVDAKWEFEKRLIQKVSCMCKQYIDIISSPDNRLTDRDLEDLMKTVYDMNKKIERLLRIDLSN